MDRDRVRGRVIDRGRDRNRGRDEKRREELEEKEKVRGKLFLLANLFGKVAVLPSTPLRLTQEFVWKL